MHRVTKQDPKMNFEQAIEIVQDYKQDWALPGLLETLEQMQNNLDELAQREVSAYRVVFREMGKLFAPA